jgi:subtilisin family serine protease
MPDPRPHHTRGSVELRLPGAESLGDITTDWAWGGSTGAGVRVAVVDSGIEHDHPLLEGCVDAGGGVAVSVDEEGTASIEPGVHEDVFGHGTACAGIIHSMAPAARITSVRVLGPANTGKAAGFLHGLAWAIDQGFEVINLSLGTTRQEWALPFYELCDRAYFENSVVVTAANNSAKPSFPSLFASVTSVACNLATDPWRYHVRPDPPTEFLARGIDVEVAWKGGGTIVMTGNSFAAPHVTALAALVRAKHPLLRPFHVKAVLWAAAVNELDAPRPAGRFSTSLRRSTVTLPADLGRRR